jgi:phospholipid/cholesterol/gamma-HCH transport system permease protein
LICNGNTLEIRLSGAFTLQCKQLPYQNVLEAVGKENGQVRFMNDGITEWDSTLPAFVLRIRNEAVLHGAETNLTQMPEGVQRLISLATAVPGRENTNAPQKKTSLLHRIGLRTLLRQNALLEWFSFLGETVTGLWRFFTRQARYRSTDFWLAIQECGPQALGIVTIISVLVGAILAFVGAIQLKMFGAEIYVANLVGLGMVIEMGALMTGIILAGRTGAAFAAQLGTMQVNEEIDALMTMGISPMEYLVIPRLVSLAIMTPLLVIYADVLGILGGAAVGITVMDIPAPLFFSQAFSRLTLWHCAQGLIKGSTFGVIVALCGCLRGMQCGRSASAVGDAATSAVVSGIVGIVLADAVWTCIFMFGGK